MSRSFGDEMAKRAGVSDEPEITVINIDEKARFIVVASDGVWEYLSNEQCVEIIEPYYEENDIEGACEALMREAYFEWTRVRTLFFVYLPG